MHGWHIVKRIGGVKVLGYRRNHGNSLLRSRFVAEQSLWRKNFSQKKTPAEAGAFF